MEVEGLKGRMTSVVIMRLIEENERLRKAIEYIVKTCPPDEGVCSAVDAWIAANRALKGTEKPVEDCLEDWDEEEEHDD